MNAKVDLGVSGNFTTGCNYWASHAGAYMWRDWQPAVVQADFRQLSDQAGLQVLRVFPLWPDFQPLVMLKGANGEPREMRLGEFPLGQSELSQAGISTEMMERFSFLLDEAGKNHLRIIVSLVTGWMSGRLFVPPAFENLNVLTDPLPMMWEIKFVKAFVKHFKDRPEILAWELGNECNCMGTVSDRETAYLWAAAIADAVKSVDSSRPFISGMHSLHAYPNPSHSWIIVDQGEICDLLTTHPYPIFTPHCDLDPIDEIRSGLHATAESRLYADVSGKPCLIEEIGTLGPMVCAEEISANYIRMSMMSAVANDCRAFLWWCAYDQDHLSLAPYDWNSVERELGLFRKERQAKPIVQVFNEFRQFAARVPTLPLRSTDAVCLLSEGQDNWEVAFSTFLLAKQAGFDLEFQRADQKLKPAQLYLLPSLNGDRSPSRTQWLELIAAVQAGATLYLSCGDALLSPFEALTGFRVQRRSRREKTAGFELDFIPGIQFACPSPYRLEMIAPQATVLGRETDGNPCFGVYQLGKGQVYFSSLPLEAALATQPGVFHAENALPWWKIYGQIATTVMTGRILQKINAPKLCITEHPLSESAQIAFLINCSSRPETYVCRRTPTWRVVQSLWGGLPQESGLELTLTMAPCSSCLIQMERS